MFWIGAPERAPCVRRSSVRLVEPSGLVGPVVPARPAERVAAALGDEVDADAAGLLRHVVAAGADLHLLQHVEVVVHGRRAGGGLVGDVDAVEEPLVVGRGRAARDVARLLARLAAAHVGAVHGDARRALEHDPGVTRRGHVLQLLLRVVALGAGLARVDERRLARDRHGLLERRDLEGRVGGGVAADAHRDALDDHRPEAGQLELDRVGIARLQARELVRAGVSCHGRQRLDERTAAHRHHHAGQHRPGRIDHAAHDIAGRGLRHRGRRPEDQAQHRHQGEQFASHPSSLKCPHESPGQRPSTRPTKRVRPAARVPGASCPGMHTNGFYRQGQSGVLRVPIAPIAGRTATFLPARRRCDLECFADWHGRNFDFGSKMAERCDPARRIE